MVKKLSWLFLLVAIIIGIPVLHTFAESGGEYQSKAGVGFTGEYVYPGDSGESGETSSDTGNQPNISDGGSSSSEEGEAQPILPQTGDVANSQMMLLGLSFIMFAFLLMYKRSSQRVNA